MAQFIVAYDVERETEPNWTRMFRVHAVVDVAWNGDEYEATPKGFESDAPGLVKEWGDLDRNEQAHILDEAVDMAVSR